MSVRLPNRCLFLRHPRPFDILPVPVLRRATPNYSRSSFLTTGDIIAHHWKAIIIRHRLCILPLSVYLPLENISLSIDHLCPVIVILTSDDKISTHIGNIPQSRRYTCFRIINRLRLSLLPFSFGSQTFSTSSGVSSKCNTSASSSYSSTQSRLISSISPVSIDFPVPQKVITVFPSPIVTSDDTDNGESYFSLIH